MAWADTLGIDKPFQDSLDHESGNHTDVNAFIGKDVQFKGNIYYKGTIRIDGNMEGEVQTEGCLLIGEGAVVTAKVIAGTIICKGSITGDVIAKEKVRLRAPATVKGTLTTPTLSMEEGVQFNGTVIMGAQDGKRKAEDDSPSSALSLA